MPSVRRSKLSSLASLLVALTACGQAEAPGPRPTLGVFGTLPIYWNESAGVEELLSDKSAPPWTRTVIEERFVAVPLDTLSGERGVGTVDAVLLAQPRALSAEENVALDDWVRGGGRALLFADPMLTMHSRFHFGDRRRPQDVVLISPILARWGLELVFDDEQAEGERVVAYDGVSLPVNLPGQLRLRGDGAANCRLSGEGLVAHCAIGAGQVTVIADAAVLEDSHHGGAPSREEALRKLLNTLVAGELGQ